MPKEQRYKMALEAIIAITTDSDARDIAVIALKKS